MTDVIEVESAISEIVVVDAGHAVIVVPDAVPDVVGVEVTASEILSTDPDHIVIVIPDTMTEVVEVAEQGPPGPPGPAGAGGGGGAGQRAELVDYTDSRHAYLGYPTRICRIDYTVWPPATQFAPIASLATSWPLRTGLTYT